VVLRQGRVEQDASAKDLRADPATEYVRELLLRARISSQ
jgi:ABC-type proline/glycine betaine transport system ATPase subunit